jgi:hypothetical protein
MVNVIANGDAAADTLDTLNEVIGIVNRYADTEPGLAASSPGRPGELRIATTATAGSVASALNSTIALTRYVTDSLMGSVLEIRGEDVPGSPGYLNVVRIDRLATESERIYRATIDLRRTVDPIDPATDTVQVYLVALDYAKSTISTVSFFAASPLLADGVEHIVKTFALEEDLSPDYVLPAGTRYVAIVVRCYGTVATTRIGRWEWEDITDANEAALLVANKADKAITVTRQGLVSGSGATLADNLVINVAKASEAQAADGLLDTVALTPKTGTDLLNARIGEGSGNFEKSDDPAINGRLTVNGIIDLDNAGPADARPYSGFVGADGRGLLLADSDAYTYGGGYRDVGQPRDELVADVYAAETIVEDVDGNALIVQINDEEEPALGGIYFEPSTALVERIFAKSGGGTSQFLRDGREIDDPVTTDELLVGSVSDRDGFRFKVAERLYGSVSAAAILSRSPMELFFQLGQSNAGVGGTTLNPRKLTGPLYSYNVFGFAQGTGFVAWSNGATTLPDPDLFTDLRAYEDWATNPELPQSQHAMTSFGIEMARRRVGTPGPGLISHLVWQGGAEIESFEEGSDLFEQMVAVAEKAVEIAALYDRELVCRAIFFRQGESGAVSGSYEDKLDGIVTAARTRLQAALGQSFAPVVIISQTNSGDEASSINDIALDQLAVVEGRPTEAYLAGPMYQARMTDSGIHADTESRMMIGEVDGEVYRRVIAGTWKELKIRDVSRSGAVITLDYRPSGVTYQLPGDDLEFDPGPGEAGDGWVKAITNHGFYYSDDSSGATISSVALVKDSDGRGTKVQITLSGNPGSATGKTLSYAQHAYDTTADSWASARGTLRSRGPASMFRRLGFATTEFVWFYAARQEVAVP